jgi:hypothetical protein
MQAFFPSGSARRACGSRKRDENSGTCPDNAQRQPPTRWSDAAGPIGSDPPYIGRRYCPHSPALRVASFLPLAGPISPFQRPASGRRIGIE